MGFEPTTSSMPSRRAPNCATAPLEETLFCHSSTSKNDAPAVYHTLSTLLSTSTSPPSSPPFHQHPNLLSSTRSRQPINNSVSSSPQVILNYRRGVLLMSSETALKANFRGVLCHHCGRPVRVPNS